MFYSLTEVPANLISTDCLVLGIYENPIQATVTQTSMPDATRLADEASQGYISRLVQQGDITGKLGQTWLLHALPNLQAKRILLVGCGPQACLTASQFTTLIQQAFIQILTTPAKEVACYLTELALADIEENLATRWKIRQQVERIEYSQYRFKPQDKQPGLQVKLLGETKHASALRQGYAIAKGVELARELGDLPPNVCTPSYLASKAVEVAHSYPALSAQILDAAEMESLGMGALLAVAKGSANPAQFIILNYQGSRSSEQPIVLIGKGVTFDTGGISIKPRENMDEMKYDMCGAASVMGTLQAAAQLELPLNLIGLIPTVENMPDGLAYRPGDIVQSLSGQTIEILNTDAEGRLILCDALTYAQRFNPRHVIDIATLTGAMVIALGSHISGLFSNDSELAKQLLTAGQISQDSAWQMPYGQLYAEQLRSNFADLTNFGGREAGSITAACFLAKFTSNYSWAHLDIAGTAMKSGKDKGATGRPVPLLVQFLLAQTGNA